MTTDSATAADRLAKLGIYLPDAQRRWVRMCQPFRLATSFS
jgi:hypothetical protein